MKVIALSIAFALCAEPVQIEHLAEIERHFDPSTLYVFDVDEVLITTEDHFNHPSAHEIYHSLISQAYQEASDRQAIDDKLSLTCLLPKRILIEETAPTLIRDLQAAGAKVIALTACDTGPFGLVPQLERWRLENLRSLGIDFRASFPELARTFLIGRSLFEEGILFCGATPKGTVLNAFLEHLPFTPSKIIFIDDRKKNLESVETAMAKLQIPCQSYHYVGAHRHLKPANRQILELQMRHLFEHGAWISDEEALLIFPHLDQ